MKITVDLKRLLNQEKITQEEFDKFAKLAKQQNTVDAFKALISIAILSTIVGFCVLFLPKVLYFAEDVLAFLGPVLELVPEQLAKLLICAAIFAAGIIFKNATMVMTGVIFGFFLLPVKLMATFPIFIIFSILSFVGLGWSKRADDYEKVALTFARTCFCIANIALFIGSLAGPTSMYYAIVWAVLLIILYVWGAYEGRQFVVTSASTFMSIHAVIQWFKWLSVSPTSLMVGGAITIVAATFIKKSYQKHHQLSED